MNQFLHYNRISDWDEDEVILVDIRANGTAYVRTFLERHVRGPLPVPEAISDAYRFKHNTPGITAIGVHLDEGAKWSASWGNLKRAI
jgi:hypothetical protein